MVLLNKCLVNIPESSALGSLKPAHTAQSCPCRSPAHLRMIPLEPCPCRHLLGGRCRGRESQSSGCDHCAGGGRPASPVPRCWSRASSPAPRLSGQKGGTTGDVGQEAAGRDIRARLPSQSPVLALRPQEPERMCHKRLREKSPSSEFSFQPWVSVEHNS